MPASEWDEYAEGWDGTEGVRAYADQAFESWQRLVAPEFSELSAARVLDFGCGTGLLTEKFAPLCATVVAVDTSPKMIEVLRRKLLRSGAGNVIAKSFEIDLETIRSNRDVLRDFDLVIASSVCSFLPDFAATLRGISSMMKPGAMFVQWDWATKMTQQQIAATYELAGLDIVVNDEAFAMEGDGESAAVIMGAGRKQVSDR